MNNPYCDVCDGFVSDHAGAKKSAICTVRVGMLGVATLTYEIQRSRTNGQSGKRACWSTDPKTATIYSRFTAGWLAKTPQMRGFLSF